MMIRFFQGAALIRAAHAAKGAAAVIPKSRLEGFIARLEDAVDHRALRKKKPEYIPVALAERLLAGDSAIRVFREWRGLTQSELAKKAGVGKSMLSQIENGSKDPSLATARRLAECLGVTLDEIF
ncbi:MAG: helix-turn-helix transcriptional regulator [Rhodospirillaceae bacterium]|nr:helix-turn-helix transcriptional regulator [Rhodospirillaceae bacterium]